MGGKRDLESFQRELEGYGDWRDASRARDLRHELRRMILKRLDDFRAEVGE